MKHKIVGIILHPLSIENVKENFLNLYAPISYFANPLLQAISSYDFKRYFSFLSPHQFLNISSIEVEKGVFISIKGIMCPLFPEQMVLDRELAKQKISESVKLAKKLGCDIVTLAGFTSIVTNGGKDIFQNEDPGVIITSGNMLTAVFCIESVRLASQFMNMKLCSAELAVIGATGDIGSTCALFFSDKVKKIILCSRNIDKELDLCKKVSEKAYSLLIERTARNAVRNADIVITATSSFDKILEISDFKSGAVVCDVGMPPNIENKKHGSVDILLYQGGRARVSFYDKINNKKWKTLFPDNAIFGCLAESIVLALEDKRDIFSFAKDGVDSKRIDELLVIAKRNGVECANVKV